MTPGYQRSGSGDAHRTSNKPRPSPFVRMLRGHLTAERYTAIWKRYFRMFPNGPWR